MRSKHDTHTSVKPMCQSQLFGSCLGVNIHDGKIVVSLLAGKDFVHRVKRACKRIHIHSANDIDTQDLPSVNANDGIPVAGRLGRIICGTNDAALIFEIRINIALSKGMISERDNIDTRVKQGLGVLRANAPHIGGIFAVCNNKVDPLATAHIPQPLS